MNSAVQPHHVKLWFAGSAANWTLAAYEAYELDETFEDVLTYQSSWHGIPIARLVGTTFKPALERINTAIAAKDVPQFKTAYAGLNAACNECHATAQHGFIKIVAPNSNLFSDQEFQP